MQGLQEAHARRPDQGHIRGAEEKASAEDRRKRLLLSVLRRRTYRAEAVQPDVQDDRRTDRGSVQRCVPASRDRPGDLCAVPECPFHIPSTGSFRHRADGQELPQRSDAAQLYVPQPRVRADGA